MTGTQKVEAIAGLSLKAFLVTVIGILLFGIFKFLILIGLVVTLDINNLQEKKQVLIQEEKALKTENQRLQKEYFELKQLEPKE